MLHVLSCGSFGLQIPTDVHPVTGKSALETVLTVHHSPPGLVHVSCAVCQVKSFNF